MSGPTHEVLATMLRENTGRHFLDSGDGYGRSFERNATRPLEQESSSTLSFRYGIELNHRLYHWLGERLDFDEEATDAFDGPFRDECDPEGDKDWGELREEFPKWFAQWKARNDTSEPCPECGSDSESCEVCGGTGRAPGDDSLYQATGIYGDGGPVTVNSYNEENLLDQVILFTYFELRDGRGRSSNIGSYVVLQIHGGCDVRGGYTRPRVFTLSDELAIFDYRRGTIGCGGREPTRQKGLPGVGRDDDARESHWWTTDDGYHWYAEGACGRSARAQLEAYERLVVEDASEWERGHLCVTEAGEGFCPLCGGRLEGGT